LSGRGAFPRGESIATSAPTPREWRAPPTFVSSGDSGRDTAHMAELEDFVEAVRDGRSTRSSIYESHKSMVLYETIPDSAETGRAIPVEYGGAK